MDLYEKKDNIDELMNLLQQGNNEDKKESLKIKNLQELMLNNVDMSKVKQIKIKSTNIYILFKDGTLYKNNKLEDKDIKEIYTYDFERIYKITIDNKIIPLSSFNDNVDKYICGNETSYKKIILGPWSITALTKDKRVVATNTIVRSRHNSRQFCRCR